MKHTPGSWEVHGHVFSQNGEKQIVVGQKGGWAVATVRRSPNHGSILEDNEDSEQTDNARLISVAPDLLELVEQAFDRFTDNDYQPPNSALRIWLKKAERILLRIEGKEANQ